MDVSEEGRTAQGAAPDAGQTKPIIKGPGKTPEELISRLKSQEEMIGKQGNEIGELRGAIERTRDEQRLAFEQERRLRELQGVPAQAMQQDLRPPDETRFNYERPVTSVYGIVDERLDEKLNQRETERKKAEQQRDAIRVQSNYIRGRDKAFSRKSPLYEGIESLVENLVQQTFMQGNVAPEDLRDEDIWQTSAQIIRLKRNEFDKVIPPKIQPVTASPGEISAQVKDFGGGGPAIEFEDGADEMLRQLGTAAGIETREKAAELLRGGKGKK